MLLFRSIDYLILLSSTLASLATVAREAGGRAATKTVNSNTIAGQVTRQRSALTSSKFQPMRKERVEALKTAKYDEKVLRTGKESVKSQRSFQVEEEKTEDWADGDGAGNLDEEEEEEDITVNLSGPRVSYGKFRPKKLLSSRFTPTLLPPPSEPDYAGLNRQLVESERVAQANEAQQ